MRYQLDRIVKHTRFFSRTSYCSYAYNTESPTLCQSLDDKQRNPGGLLCHQNRLRTLHISDSLAPPDICRLNHGLLTPKATWSAKGQLLSRRKKKPSFWHEEMYEKCPPSTPCYPPRDLTPAAPIWTQHVWPLIRLVCQIWEFLEKVTPNVSEKLP